MKSYEKGKSPYIIFGSKCTERIGTELKKYDIRKCLIVTGQHISRHMITQKIFEKLKENDIDYDVFNRVLPEPTDESCLEIASQIKSGHYDCVLGIGGGSPMDAAKTAALIAGIPEQIADLHDYGKSGKHMKENWKRPCMLVLIPTTSGTGAETTPSAVITSKQHEIKFSFGNNNMTADLCLIDPEYTLGMPAMPTIYGGVDALAHSIENLVGTGANEYTDMILLSCLGKIWKWLPVAVQEPNNLEAREQLSWAAHNALANGGIPNGHAVAHAIGSLYHIVHGHACMLVLPTVIRHFADDSQEAIQSIAKVIGVPISGNAQADADHVADSILAFYKRMGLKPLSVTLQENGFNDDEAAFIRKMVPAVMDDFKSRQWLPPIHTGDYYAKIGRICAMIYEEE